MEAISGFGWNGVVSGQVVAVDTTGICQQIRLFPSPDTTSSDVWGSEVKPRLKRCHKTMKCDIHCLQKRRQPWNHAWFSRSRQGYVIIRLMVLIWLALLQAITGRRILELQQHLSKVHNT